MDSKDIELKSALDEIFGDDIIELDEDIPVIEKKEPTNEELFENTSTLVFNNDDLVSTKEELNLDKKTLSSDIEIPITFDIPTIDSNGASSNILDETKTVLIEEKKDDNENAVTEINDNKKIVETIEETKEHLEEKKSNIPLVKVVIISILVTLLTLGSVYFCVNFIGNKDKTVNCSYVFEDTNYKITDEYKITYQNNQITYVEGIYMYTSKTNEYDEQIKYIKEDKLPAIINSNGMKGFTYTYENTDDSIKISSYLDYTIMDENEIRSIDQNIKPISYFIVDFEDNNKNLTKLFKNQGYKCTSIK